MTSVSQVAAVASTSRILSLPMGACDHNNIGLKDGQATIYTPSSSGFFTALDKDHADYQYETDTYSASANTDEQTMVDYAGEGILTHVLTPMLNGGGVATVRITIDSDTDNVITLVSDEISASYRMWVGGILQMYPEIGSNTVGIGGANDTGFHLTEKFFVPTPAQIIALGLIGKKFSSNLKVTIQGSNNWITAVAEDRKAFVGYTTYIPEGY